LTVKIKSKGTKLDFTQTAAAVVFQSIGENLFDGSPCQTQTRAMTPKPLSVVDWVD
jgi:hypothetical protein